MNFSYGNGCVVSATDPRVYVGDDLGGDERR
jgi:hypothetical protein